MKKIAVHVLLDLVALIDVLLQETEKHIGVAYGEFVLDLNQISHYFDGPLLKDKQHVFKVKYLILCKTS